MLCERVRVCVRVHACACVCVFVCACVCVFVCVFVYIPGMRKGLVSLHCRCTKLQHAATVICGGTPTVYTHLSVRLALFLSRSA